MKNTITKIWPGILRTRIRQEHTQRSEKILGYFLGPCLVQMAYCVLAGTYLIQFYTDVLGLTGIFLTMMPLLSKLLSSIIGLCFGRIIDRTHTAQGKARPYLLLSGVLLALCSVLLYSVPKASEQVQLVWIVVSYNLFFGIAYNIYSLSHALMVPLSTYDVKERDFLAMLTSTGVSMVPGCAVTVIMPLLVQWMGLGAGAQHMWLTVMSVISAAALPAAMLEYYFTRERVTEKQGGCQQSPGKVSYRKQVLACITDRYWLAIILANLFFNLAGGLSTQSMLYFCNWVLSSSVADGAVKQILINVIGQAPMGLGALILWPLIRKFGKRRVTLTGFSLATAGCLIILLNPQKMVAVIGGLLIKSFGCLPTYIMNGYLAQALDHVEEKNGFRADGFSASVINIIQTVSIGISQTILLWGIQALGYIAPLSAAQTIAQPSAVQGFFSWCFAGFPMIGWLLCTVCMSFCDRKKSVTQGRES